MMVADNMMGLMLARDAFFARQGHSIQQDGLPGDVRPIMLLWVPPLVNTPASPAP